MKTVILTDGKYRSALAAARDLGRRGCRVIVTQTREDCAKAPPVFSSRFATGLWIDGSVSDPAYPERLLALIARERGGEKPVLLCVGAGTLCAVAAHREDFSQAADFLAAEPEVLDALNDKQTVHDRAQALGLTVPRQYAGTPDRYPVVVKPHCGEKLGLKAADRYAVAENETEYRKIFQTMRDYDGQPIVQERIQGPGRGVSLLLDRESRLIGAICHRRVREYPMSGGPSTCCVTEFDAERIRQAAALLGSFGFTGLAMVEFKGDAILEVNPRIWGSFPLVPFSGSPMLERYVRAAGGERLDYAGGDYAVGRKMRFCFNDLAASADLLRHGKLRAGCEGLLDFFRVREGLKDREDKKAYRAYLRSYL